VTLQGRAQLRFASVIADLTAVAAAHVLAVWLRNIAHLVVPIRPLSVSVDWALAVLMMATVGASYAAGLYEREAYVSRPLHVWAIARAALVAFLLCALAVYLLKSDSVDQSRLILTLTFLLFMPLSWLLRVGILDRMFRKWVATHHPVAFLIGDSREAQNLAERLVQLRGFSDVVRISSADLRPQMEDSVGRLLDERSAGRESADAMFVDTQSVSPREVFEITHAARPRGVDVYILSGLLGPLEGSRLLNVLFQSPVIRVRRRLEDANAHLTKRMFDVIGSAVLLVLASPLMAGLAVLIKSTSRGPVFYSQARVGRFGVPFEFYKFRSMVVNADATDHAEYVKAFIVGHAETVDREDGQAVFKRVYDPRITPVGRFIRKYSLDEIPQFWNVLKGDMSLVGPRPPLPYEVEHYDDWSMSRLLVPPGVTGMWQVEGRSRVTFDEMILQDLMYAKNMRLLVDVKLCLRTIPAALLGYGGG
jgi:exopolysaccharide biosynthesis polyprenyl glycosylphosphotransferase